MNSKRLNDGKSGQATRLRHEHEAEGGAAGALVGAMMGGVAGPPGAVAGAILGAAVGAASAMAMDRAEADEARRTEVLDDEIGISGGDMGAPNLEHPPPASGAFSAAWGAIATPTRVDDTAPVLDEPRRDVPPFRSGEHVWTTLELLEEFSRR